MAGPHGFGSFAQTVSQLQDNQFKDQHLGSLEERAHRQDRKFSGLIIGHGLGGNK